MNKNKTSEDEELYDNSIATTQPIPTQHEQNEDDCSTHESHEGYNELDTNLNESVATVEEFMPDVDNQDVNLPLNF